MPKSLDTFIDYRYSLPLDWFDIDSYFDLFEED